MLFFVAINSLFDFTLNFINKKINFLILFFRKTLKFFQIKLFTFFLLIYIFYYYKEKLTFLQKIKAIKNISL